MKIPDVQKKELLEIIKKYILDKKLDYKFIESGIENVNYLIKINKKKFVLRIYNEARKPEDIEAEIKVIDYLSKNNIPTPKVIPNLKKENLTEHNGRYAVMFSFVEGEQPPLGVMDSLLAKDIGVNLADMHHLLLSFKGEFRRFVPPSTSFEEIGERGIIDKKIIIHKKEVEGELNSLPLKNLRECIVHSDITRENIKIKDSSISAFLDFDDLHKDYLVWDVAIAITHLFITKTFGIDWKGLKYFFDGYNATLPLTDLEKEALVPLMKLRNVKLAMLVNYRRKKNLGNIDSLLSIEGSVLRK